MKKLMKVLAIVIMVTSLSLVACKAKVDQTQTPADSTIAVQDTTVVVK